MAIKKLASILAAFIFLGIFQGCSNGSDAEGLFSFDDAGATKDVAVHVTVNLLATDDSGAKIEVGEAEYSLNAYVYDGDSYETVGMGLTGLALTDTGIIDYPVTVSGETFSFDTIIKVPTSISAGDDGYSFQFTLKAPDSGAGLNLADTEITGNLRSFKTQVKPGRPASENEIPISLSTTIASDLMDALEIPYSQESFDELTTSILPLLETAGSEIDEDTTHESSPYVMGLVARTMMLLASDTSTQESLVQVVTAASSSEVASSTVMSKISTTMNTLANKSSTVFGADDDKRPVNVFKSTVSVEITSAVTNPTYDTVYTPSAVSFTDTDTSSKIGGTVSITVKSSSYAPASYNVYLGGDEKDGMTLVSLGNAEISSKGTSATLKISSGTSLPSGATSLWVYPVANDGTEIDAPKVVSIKNVSSASPSIKLTGPSSIDSGATVTLTGTCSSKSAKVTITAPSGFSPSTGTCSCSGSALTSCTTFTDTGFTAGQKAKFTVKITDNGASTSTSIKVSVKASAASTATTTFGAPFGNYMEDGLQSLCVKVSDVQITCKGGYFTGDNDVTTTTGWTDGATIRGYYNLEATTFIEDTEGNIWSVGSGPIGRATNASNSTLGKITFTGKTDGTNLIGIHGEHGRATALFNDGQVFSWAGTTPPAERLTSGVHTPPVKFVYEGYGHECFIDDEDDLYCKDSSPSTAAFQWTPSASELALSDVKSLSMPWNHSSATWDVVIIKTDGSVITTPRYTPANGGSYTDTGVTASSAAGNFGFTPATGTEDFLVVGSDGKAYNKSGAIAALGSSNVAVGVSYNGVNGYKHFVLSDGSIQGSAATDMSSPGVFGSYTDITTMRAFFQDVCGIRENGEIRCAGTNSGGTYASPTLMGTMSTENE